MTDREFFTKTIADELPRFDRLFKALPQEHAGYKPDPKSKSALELAAYMAGEASTFEMFLKTGKVDMAVVGKPTSKTFIEAAEKFAKFLSDAKEIAGDMSQEDWQSPAQMLTGEKVEWETTKGAMAISLLLDLIHHRGQLSTYIRPMGGKVPSIYGPSADTNS